MGDFQYMSTQGAAAALVFGAIAIAGSIAAILVASGEVSHDFTDTIDPAFELGAEVLIALGLVVGVGVVLSIIAVVVGR